MSKNIQLWTARESEYCEIDGNLKSIDFNNGIVVIKSTEGTSKKVWEHIFPLWNVRMIRISEEG